MKNKPLYDNQPSALDPPDFLKVIYLKDIDNEAKKMAASFKADNPVNASDLDYSGFQIMQSLAAIKSSFQMLQAREERLRRTYEISGDAGRCNNKPTDGWRLNGPYLYYFSTETKNWFDAKKYCSDNNSNLLSIKSKEEQFFLAYARGNNNYWIGLTNDKPGGIWYFTDGSEYKDPLFWAPYQPDNWKAPDGRTEHCAEMSKGGTWNDILCSIHSRWICKKHCMAK
ncbi:CD209 antigen-like protein C isoform X2 [Pleurodeles waltl]|uniref:CD209 antigen-like protein C isoform X2 n=1 Tax=Pleurodeles waltl TaxID=8319 RepID=UPI0037097703